MEFVVNFTLNNEPLNTGFTLSENTSFDALFKIDSSLKVEGSELINVENIKGTAIITSKTYTHEQGIATDEWIINHGLNKYPSVTLVDSAGTQFQGRVEYIDENNCIVTMNGATKGKAYLN